MNWFLGHSETGLNHPDKRSSYTSPCILSDLEVELEQKLLVASIVYSTMILTEGQASVGFFEGEDVVTEDNPWLD